MGLSVILASLLNLVSFHPVAPATGLPERPSGVAVPPTQPDKDPQPVPPPTPVVAACKLLTPEAPRGGRLEVEGDRFGKTPVVRIGGRVARTLERAPQRIAVQIAADSNGGPVTVTADGKEVQCGMLVIIGRN